MTGFEKAEDQNRRFQLAGKTAVVTGGHRGIGRGIAKGIALAGGNVIIIDIVDPKHSDNLHKEIQALGCQHAWIQADFNHHQEVLTAARKAIEIAHQWHSRIDILVNNAGVALLSTIQQLTMEQWDNTMNINLRAPLLLSKELVTAQGGMLDVMQNNSNNQGDDDHHQNNHNHNHVGLVKPGGVIVNVTSVAAQSGHQFHAAYSASKAALESLTRTMTGEWAPLGIRVNSVAPTVTLTDMGRGIWVGTDVGRELLERLPAGRFAEVHNISDVVVFLCSEASAMIHGSVIRVDGGFNAL